MSTETKSWSETDPCLALDTALSDTWLTPDRRTELMQTIISDCLISPKVYRQLWDYGKHSLLTGELAQRARQASLSHPQGAAFRAWLDSVPTLRVQSKSVHTPLLTQSQRAAWNALEETADLYFGGTLRESRIQPRTSRLIAGPSGVGKTHLVRTFAREQGCGFLSLSYGAWLPSGSKHEETTAELVMKFIAAHERCVIAIDELDKSHDCAEVFHADAAIEKKTRTPIGLAQIEIIRVHDRFLLVLSSKDQGADLFLNCAAGTVVNETKLIGKVTTEEKSMRMGWKRDVVCIHREVR